MASVESRIDRIEQLLGNAQCVCNARANSLAFVIVEPEWDKHRIKLAESACRFTCPTHGLHTPPILRLSPAEAAL